MNDAIILFRDAFHAAYGPLDLLPEPDGAIHRFRVAEDKPGPLDGRYVFYLDGIASGALDSCKTGGASTWCSREPVDAREATQICERVDQARRQSEAEQHRRQQQAAEKANHWWRNARRASPAPPYLITKAVSSYGLRQRGADLLIPRYLDGRLSLLAQPAEAARQVETLDTQARHTHWRVMLSGKAVCSMIGEPMTEAQALEEV